MKRIIYLILLVGIISSCNKKNQDTNITKESDMNFISKNAINSAIDSLNNKFGQEFKEKIKIGVNQTATLWIESDGSEEEFIEFCKNNYIADTIELNKTVNSLAYHYEQIIGHFNRMNLFMKVPMQLEVGEMTNIDRMFGSLDLSSHFTEDLYKSKIAFLITLNFPFYSLKEKMKQGKNWTRMEWCYARLGDQFIARTPAELIAKASETEVNADQYIAEYNIMMGEIVDEKMNTFFPKDMALITHWNLRDEIKAQYANKTDGVKKQKLIYKIMERIIDQSIPQDVISNADFKWNPYSNKVYKDGKLFNAKREPDTRYEWLLKNFKAQTELDKFNPYYKTYISRNFDRNMEIPVERIEEMFKELLSSPAAKEVADLIKNNLGRNLEAYDIWYNGFKGEIDGEKFDKITKAKYKNSNDLKKDLPFILKKLGWNNERANYITSKIDVDPARGAGHAAGSQMKGDNAHLRTRIGKDGMDYKGYNIAIHEFGHNVEQTISLYDVDYWFLRGIPNTAFTEAAAFLFQQKDLKLLGVAKTNPQELNNYALNVFWSCYEIMGVSLVDIKVWKWMYENPDANSEELRKAVLNISKEVWNEYYSPVFGKENETILAIYSHMIAYPLYLSAYPVGHLIEFQLDQFLLGKNFANEFERIYTGGSITPDNWMMRAVGEELSVKPVIKAAEKAVKEMKEK